MVSVVILAKNEEEAIKDCLESVAWADEKIVIDDFSEDKTAEIAKKLGATVYKHPLQNDFAQQRNFGLDKANGDWVLFLDADERVSHSLQYEINTAIHDSLNIIQGYYLKRLDTMWGKQLTHGEIGSIMLLRLARKNSGRWKGKVHEVWEVKGKKDKLANPLDHFPHQSIRDFLREINYYSTLRAQELHKKKKKSNSFQIVAFPVGKFISNYLFRLGFLDGIPGLLIAVMMSFHSFLVRGKLWQLTHQKGEKKA